MSYGQSYTLSKFDYKFLKTLKDTSDDLLKRWLPKICNILLAVRNSFYNFYNLSDRKFFFTNVNSHLMSKSLGFEEGKFTREQSTI